MPNIKLSIIMPLYNVEKTIKLALESILMQEVDFPYEIIAVNDASTDSTKKILNSYAHKYKQIRIIEHKENQGNAIAFYDGLCASKGDYFSVLDGDDYYTVKNKLQKQVDFLDGDKKKQYAAVSHKYLRVNTDFEYLYDPQLFNGEQEWTYLDLLSQKFYSHTTTYMYRNVFRNKVPELFKGPLYRGDNPRTFMHMLYSKGKIKQLNFVGSAYYYNGNGIWSQTSPQAQKQRNISMLEELGKNLPSQLEKQILDGVCEYRKKNLLVDRKRGQAWVLPEVLLDRLVLESQKYAYRHSDFVFQQVYKSEFIDSFCESIGFVEMVRRGYRPFKPVTTKENHILIAVSQLTNTGGGVFYEIKDIVNMYPKHKVYILWTDLDGKESLNSDVREQLSKFKNLTHLYGQSINTNKLRNLCDKIISIAPKKIYHYCGHDNVWLCSLIQSMLSKNICIFSFDHGFSLGLDNTNYDTYIAKRSMDYEILSQNYGQKVIYIPCFHSDKVSTNKYIPFKSHDKLITACAAARYYKLSSGSDEYIDIVAQLLQKTGGKHIHYGKIPEKEWGKIKSTLAKYKISEDRFINLAWVNNLPDSMYHEEVDIFIEPFPIVSYKITLDVLSAGIPVIARKSYIRMGITDFIYPEHLSWATTQDLIHTLSAITKNDLQKHSLLSREYYEKHHLPKVLLKSFTTETNFSKPFHIPFWDNILVDVSEIDDLLDVTIHSKKYSKFKKCYKEIYYGMILIISQLPIINLFIKSSTRQRVLKGITKYYW